MKRFTIAVAVALCLCVGVVAQQLEVNDANGNLTRNGTDPVPGSPFIIEPDEIIELDVGGMPNVGYALGSGQLAATSMQLAFLDNQFLDLDQSLGIFLIGSAFGGGALDPNFFFLNSSGANSFDIGVNNAFLNTNIAFQAITFDPTLTSQFNLTAAVEYSIQIVTKVVLTGDDERTTYSFPNGPMLLYSQPFTEVDVSTNGWIKFGSSTGSDLSEDSTDFEQGDYGGGAAGVPGVAILWEDLDMANTADAAVCIDQPVMRILHVDFVNGDYFSTTDFGDVSCTIDNTGGNTVITLDYSGYIASPPTEGLVGVTDGGSAGSTITAHDLVVGGVVNPFASGGGAETIYQNHDGGAGTVPAIPAEPFSLGGLIVTFADSTAGGDFSFN